MNSLIYQFYKGFFTFVIFLKISKSDQNLYTDFFISVFVGCFVFKYSPSYFYNWMINKATLKSFETTKKIASYLLVLNFTEVTLSTFVWIFC